MLRDPLAGRQGKRAIAFKASPDAPPAIFLRRCEHHLRRQRTARKAHLAREIRKAGHAPER
eukprot:8009525-Alexandrium_andersonii.AAC.1